MSNWWSNFLGGGSMGGQMFDRDQVPNKPLVERQGHGSIIERIPEFFGLIGGVPGTRNPGRTQEQQPGHGYAEVSGQEGQDTLQGDHRGDILSTGRSALETLGGTISGMRAPQGNAFDYRDQPGRPTPAGPTAAALPPVTGFPERDAAFSAMDQKGLAVPSAPVPQELKRGPMNPPPGGQGVGSIARPPTKLLNQPMAEAAAPAPVRAGQGARQGGAAVPTPQPAAQKPNLLEGIKKAMAGGRKPGGAKEPYDPLAQAIEKSAAVRFKRGAAQEATKSVAERLGGAPAGTPGVARPPTEKLKQPLPFGDPAQGAAGARGTQGFLPGGPGDQRNAPRPAGGVEHRGPPGAGIPAGFPRQTDPNATNTAPVRMGQGPRGDVNDLARRGAHVPTPVPFRQQVQEGADPNFQAGQRATQQDPVDPDPIVPKPMAIPDPNPRGQRAKAAAEKAAAEAKAGGKPGGDKPTTEKAKGTPAAEAVGARKAASTQRAANRHPHSASAFNDLTSTQDPFNRDQTMAEAITQYRQSGTPGYAKSWEQEAIQKAKTAIKADTTLSAKQKKRQLKGLTSSFGSFNDIWEKVRGVAAGMQGIGGDLGDAVTGFNQGTAYAKKNEIRAAKAAASSKKKKGKASATTQEADDSPRGGGVRNRKTGELKLTGTKTEGRRVSGKKGLYTQAQIDNSTSEFNRDAKIQHNATTSTAMEKLATNHADKSAKTVERGYKKAYKDDESGYEHPDDDKVVSDVKAELLKRYPTFETMSEETRDKIMERVRKNAGKISHPGGNRVYRNLPDVF